MMTDVERGLSVLGHTPSPTSSSARWYRFDIDCAAHPAGVSVRALMREADGPRRKVKSSASASTTVGAGNGTTGGPAAAETASNRTAVHGVAAAAAATATAAPEGGAEVTALSAPSFGKVGLAAVAPLGSAAGIGDLPIPANAAVVRKTSGGSGGSKDAVGNGSAANDVVTAHNADASDADAAIESNTDSAEAVAAGPTDVSSLTGIEPGPEPAAERQPKAGGPQHQHRERASNWMSVIERLELEYGGGGAFGRDGSLSGSGSDESDGDDAEDRGSGGDGNGNEGVEGEGNGNGNGNGGEGYGGGKKKGKSKKKPVRKHSFDYEDDFIDDSELEKQYYAKEASSMVQTVHSGFFANQGAVATVEPDGGKESAGGAGADGTGVGDGDLVIRKKKKPKSSSSNEAGEGTKTSSGSSKKRKPPAESSAGPRKTPKVSDQQAVLADRSTGSVESSGSTQQRLGEGGSTSSSVNGMTNTAPGAVASAASSAAAVAFSGGASGSGAAASLSQEGDGASSRSTTGTGGVKTPGNGEARSKDSPVTDATGAGVAASAASGVENGGGGKGGSGEKSCKNGTKPPAPSFDPNLETAITKFEEDSKAWVAGGRTVGEEADRVLEDMRALDVFARRTLADVHNSRTYLMRLAAVYGKPPLEMKTMLIGLKERNDREECTRLQQEFNALRSVFVSEVAASVRQLASTGQPLAPPFSWSDNLRGHLHDMLKAFEAWSLKEHGGPRTRQALTETKALYDQLAQEWPTELSMTADCLRKMFNNEKRRIKAKANKEAAAEAGPALATDISPPSLSSSPAATAVTPTTQITPPANESATATSFAPAANNSGTAGFLDGPARQQQPGLSMPPPAPQRQAPKIPVVPPRSSKETPASPTSTATAPGTPLPVPSPVQQQALPLAGGGGTGGTLSFAEVSAATLSPALTTEFLPPKGSRFDLPPSFDPRNFEEEMDDDDDGVAVIE